MCCDGQQEEGEEPPQGVLGERRGDLDADGSTRDRGHAEHERRPPANVPIAALPPRARRNRRQNRKQRGRLGAELGESERDERRDEQDSAADAEKTRQHTCRKAEQEGQRDRGRAHTSSQTAIAASNPANASVEGAPGDALLDGGSRDGADSCRQPDEGRVADVHVTLERVEDRPRESRDSDRCERRAGCEAPLEAEKENQQRHDDDAAADAEEGAEEAGDEADENELQRHRSYPRAVNGDFLLARIAEAPEKTAILLDVDGVLAPIVDVPHDSAVPEETQVELRRLNGRYALVACISGRSSADARRVVGLDELVYVGEHGLELEPEAAAWSDRLQRFAATVDWDDIERKPLTVSFHYRRAENESEALQMLEAVATRARHEGLVARFGRKVLELRPPVDAHKGTAVTHLLGERGLERALYAGDDTTDLDAFNALRALELGVTVAVASPEGPAALREAADVVVDGPPAMLKLLRSL